MKSTLFILACLPVFICNAQRPVFYKWGAEIKDSSTSIFNAGVRRRFEPTSDSTVYFYDSICSPHGFVDTLFCQKRNPSTFKFIDSKGIFFVNPYGYFPLFTENTFRSSIATVWFRRHLDLEGNTDFEILEFEPLYQTWDDHHKKLYVYKFYIVNPGRKKLKGYVYVDLEWGIVGYQSETSNSIIEVRRR